MRIDISCGAIPLSENDAAFEVNRSGQLTEHQRRYLQADIWTILILLAIVMPVLFFVFAIVEQMSLFALASGLLVAISIYPIWIRWIDVRSQPIYICVPVRKERWMYARLAYGKGILHLPNKVWIKPLPDQYDAIRDGWTYELYYTPRSHALLSFRPWATDFGPFQPPR